MFFKILYKKQEQTRYFSPYSLLSFQVLISCIIWKSMEKK